MGADTTITGARFIAETLKGYGVTHVFYVDAILRKTMVDLEELGIRAVDTFREAGGEELRVAPCVNDDDLWAAGVAALAREGWA